MKVDWMDVLVMVGFGMLLAGLWLVWGLGAALAIGGLVTIVGGFVGGWMRYR